MNYLNFFDIKCFPFDKKSSGAFKFESKSYQECIARLNLTAEQGGMFHLYGDYGTGKSALLKNWVQMQVNSHKTKIIYINFVKVRSYGILFLLAKKFNLKPAYSKVKLVGQLLDFFNTFENHPIIIIDDVQELPDECLSDIRLLSSKEFDTEESFCLILSSHNSLLSQLSKHRSLKQRIELFHELLPLDKEECALYLQKRIKAAGFNILPFNQDALKLIFEHSSGILRIINKIANLSLITAAASNIKLIEAQVVQNVIFELNKYQGAWLNET